MLVIKSGKENICIDNNKFMIILQKLDLFKTIKKYNKSKAVALKVELKEKYDYFTDNMTYFYNYQGFGNNNVDYCGRILDKLISFLNKHSDEKITVYEDYENGVLKLCR